MKKVLDKQCEGLYNVIIRYSRKEICMEKQQFFITVPILDHNGLYTVNYEYVGFPERNVGTDNESHFPGVPMLVHNYDPRKNAEVVFIRTVNTANNNPELNFNTLKNEIAAITDNQKISEKLRAKFKGNTLIENAKEILVDYDESYTRHLKFLRDLCTVYQEDAEIYMDITYGSKVTPLVSVSSLVYAENAKNCSLRELIYGMAAQSKKKKIFDVKAMYRMSQALNLGSFTSGMDLDKLLESFSAEE